MNYSDLIFVYPKFSVLLLIAKSIAVLRNAKLSMIWGIGIRTKNVPLTLKSKTFPSFWLYGVNW